MTELISRVDELAEKISVLSGSEVSDGEKSLILTRALDESYRHIISAMQEADKLKNYEHVTNSLINEEMRRNEETGNNKDTTSESAFYSNQRGKNYRGKRGFNRGRGYQGYNNQDRNEVSTKFEGECRYCGIYGHKESDC